jgi:glycerol-3-phosphate dehydrogenase
MTKYYVNLSTGEVMDRGQILEEAFTNIKYEDAIDWVLGHNSAKDIINHLPTSMVKGAYDAWVAWYMKENFKEYK